MSETKARPKKTAKGWTGFARRLWLALEQRKEEGLFGSQNELAELAGLDSGQLAKIVSGERALGVTANTVLLLGEALDVNPLWLMTGKEPSGLDREPKREEPEPQAGSQAGGSLRPVVGARS